MKKINMQKIILVLIPVLFIFSGVSKADTFTYIDNATQAMGGAGFDNCNMCQYTFLLQTDKPIYTENANGGGETVYVISSAYQGPPSTQIVQSGNYSIQQNNSGQFTTMLTSGNNDPGYSFEVGTDSNGSPSYWDVNRAYRVVENFGGFDTSGGSFIVNYNGQYDPGASYDLVSSPMVWFTLQSGTTTSTSTNCNATQTTQSTVSTTTDILKSIDYHHLSCSSSPNTPGAIVTPFASQGSTSPGVTSQYYVGSSYKTGQVSSITCSPSVGFVSDYTNNCGTVTCSSGSASISYISTTTTTTTSSCETPKIFVR